MCVPTCPHVFHAFLQVIDALRTSASALHPQCPGDEWHPTLERVGTAVETMGAMLLSDPSPYRLQYLLFPVSGSAFGALIAYLTAQPKCPPEAVEAVEAVAKLRGLMFQALTNLISLCSQDHLLSDAEPQDSIYPELSRRCCHSVMAERGVEAMLADLRSKDSPEALQVAAVECLFVLVVRNAHGRSAFAERGWIPQLLAHLQVERCPVIRNYLCAILREFADQHAASLVDCQYFHPSVALVQNDPSPDVRALTAETLDCVFKMLPRSFADFPAKAALVEAVRQRLASEQSTDVLNAVFRLLATVFAIEGFAYPGQHGGGTPGRLVRFAEFTFMFVETEAWPLPLPHP